ncbi:MAG: ThiF family adenylyltransferase [Pseudomonadota bacterium]
MSTCDILISGDDFDQLMSHLYPGDHDEHGAVLKAGVVRDGAELRLLVRSVTPARAGTDYVESKIGYRALHPTFIHRQITQCRDEGLAYLAVHNHDCDDRVGFSAIDIASHERGYPALRDIGKGVPVGALVFGRRSAQADIWLPDGNRLSLRELKVIGRSLRRLRPAPAPTRSSLPSFDRQVRMFGDAGQELLRASKIAVIGLGGIGSLVAEYLGRLGVGELVLIDPDVIEDTNLSRVVGAMSSDVASGALKTTIAARHVCELDDGKFVHEIADDVAKLSVALKLRDCDYLFLAADSMRARLVFNALVHQYLIPGVQLGAKVRTDAVGALDDAMSAVREVRPGHGCLWCNQLIDPAQLAIEAKTDAERKAQAYGTHASAPSVITLNAVAAAHAVNDFLFYFLGIREDEAAATYHHFHYLRGFPSRVMPRRDAECRECGADGRFARGDAVPLPGLDK